RVLRVFAARYPPGHAPLCGRSAARRGDGAVPRLAVREHCPGREAGPRRHLGRALLAHGGHSRPVGDGDESALRTGGRAQGGGLPVASPWLNNIEPCWTHAKKAIMEIDRKLTAAEITHRVCEHFGCELLPYLKMDVAGDGALTWSIPEPPEGNS